MEFGWPLATGLAVLVALCALASALLKKGEKGKADGLAEPAAAIDAEVTLQYQLAKDRRHIIIDVPIEVGLPKLGQT